MTAARERPRRPPDASGQDDEPRHRGIAPGAVCGTGSVGVDRHGDRGAGGRHPRRAPRASGCGRRGGADARQHGFVTAELAAVLPAVVMVLALSVWAVATAGLKVRAVDAAGSAALAAARGEDAQAVAAPYLPPGASVSVTHDGDVVRATVIAPSRPLGALTPAFEVSAEAVAPKEPGRPE